VRLFDHARRRVRVGSDCQLVAPPRIAALIFASVLLHGCASISQSLGTSKSHTLQTQDRQTAVASANLAGGNVKMQASEGDVRVRGSTIDAGGTVSLNADKGRVLLEAAQSKTTEHSESSSSSASIGAAISTQGIGFTASGSRAKSNGDGASTTHQNTHVRGAQGVNIDSAGDASLVGAVVSGPQVTGHVGGNLLIESPQDTARYDEKSKSAGASATIGAGAGGSLSYGKTSIHSNYQSVGEQSAIRAGDGGFQLQVDGKTELKGGAIASTQAAVDTGKNQFTSQGGITTEDVQNSAAYSAKSAGGTLGVGGHLGASGVGIGNDHGNASSTSQAGITGIAGNADLRTGDKETGIQPIFNKDKVKTEVQDQVAVTTALGQQGARTIGTYVNGQRDKASENAGKAAQSPDGTYEGKTQEQWVQDAADWSEGSKNRVLAHALLGGLSGGVSGAAGAAASSVVVPLAGDILAGTDLPVSVKQGILQIVGAGTGAAVGGTAGAATATNATANNYLSHNPNNSRNSQLAAFSRELASCKATAGCNVDDVYARWTAISNEQQGQVQGVLADGFAGGNSSGQLGPTLAGAAGAVGANPSDFCSAGDTRCANFILNNNRQATSVLTTAASMGYLEVTGPGSVRGTGAVTNRSSGAAGTSGALGGKSPLSGGMAADEYVNILSPADRQHILFGDSAGSGGHMYPGQPGKTTYPQSWTEGQILHNVGDVVTSPTTQWYAQTGSGGLTTKAGDPARWVAWETRDGVSIRVVFEPATGRTVTAFPDLPPATNNLMPIAK
jgi:hypothetical protein